MNFGGELILITKLWTGMEEFFFNGRCEFSGLPSFWKVLIELLEEPRIEKIHTILFIPDKPGQRRRPVNEPLRTPEKYVQKLEVYPFRYSSKFSELVSALRASLLTLELVRRRNVKLIYGHGRFAAVAGLVSKISGVPNIRRFYGAYGMNNVLKNGPFLAFLKDPLTMLSVTLPADAVIITDDGTGGDEVFSPERRSKYGIKKFLHLLNGVDKNLEEKIIPPEFQLPKNYIVMLGRIEPIKGQHLLIEALRVLKGGGVEIPAFIVGHVSDPEYYTQLQRLVEEHGMEDQVHFIGGLSWHEAMYLLRDATISCLLSTFSNLSNVLLESLTLGVPTIAIEHKSNLSRFPDDVLVKVPDKAIEKPEMIAQVLVQYLENAELRMRLSNNARQFARQNLMDWNERIALEKELILSYYDSSE